MWFSWITTTTCLMLDVVMQSSPPHRGSGAMSGDMAMSIDPLVPLSQPATRRKAKAKRRAFIPPSYRVYGQCVVHVPVSQLTVTAFIAQLLPSSATVACAMQPHCGQVASHAVSAVLNVSRSL